MVITVKLKSIKKLRAEGEVANSWAEKRIKEVESEFKTKVVELCKEYNIGYRDNGCAVFLEDNDYGDVEMTEENIKEIKHMF